MHLRGFLLRTISFSLLAIFRIFWLFFVLFFLLFYEVGSKDRADEEEGNGWDSWQVRRKYLSLRNLLPPIQGVDRSARSATHRMTRVVRDGDLRVLVLGA